ncbi:coatomer subunit delta [Folsomia candida]|uniref:Coatomer subunit delta n=1 Tax=Folsomia candida TaxID=158441 RepID=A0A226EV39_FOLCA|nr:coatomer subunit delta [Folsomia candida]OXA60681.1 Coatomer subunit delta [Folsomia candida]
MVLLAAAILLKSGKTLLSRQFVEMTKSRIEGLLAAFPKLIPAGKQHTFVETDSVRYVYQPLEKLYIVLITTKASNILEDLETLRLFAKVIPEYCRNLEESDVMDNAFNLIFAFDEIVALGYRENVNLAQIRTFVEMDSHEEKVYQAVRKSQEKEAMQKMREKAKELQRQRLENQKRGIKPTSGSGSYTSMSSSGSSMSGGPSVISSDTSIQPPSEPTRSSFMKPSGTGKALKLGSKSRDVESFVDQLKSEGERVAPVNTSNNVNNKTISGGGGGNQPSSNAEDVHLKIDETIALTAGRDGGLQNMEVHGTSILRVQEESSCMIRIQFDNADTRGIQFQTHPNVDKDLFRNKYQIGLKNAQKPFPVNTDVPILKWRYQTTDETQIPLSINCWPSENGSGGCDVNIEYELQNEDLELNDVTIIIPVPSGGSGPVVSECEGDYVYEARKNHLLWQLPVIDSSNKTGSMEFSVPNGHASQFFPVQVSFHSSQAFARLSVINVKSVEDGSVVKHSVDTVFSTKTYEIV